MYPRMVAAALLVVGLLAPARALAQASCADERGGCGYFQSFAGLGYMHSSSRVDGEREVTLYGLSLAQRGLGLIPSKSGGVGLLDVALDLSIGLHAEGGPPGGSVLLAGGFGWLLPLGRAPLHGPFGKASLRQRFHGDRAITHYRIDLPALELGHAVHARAVSSELSGRAGLELFATDALRLEHQSEAGRGEEAWRHSHFAAPFIGGGARLMTRNLSFELAAQRAFPRAEPGAWLDRAETLLCATGFWVGVCGQATFLRARASGNDPEVRGVRAGVSVGVGLSRSAGDTEHP
jgi:hypothetical protein